VSSSQQEMLASAPDWADVMDFAQWYGAQGFPLFPVKDFQVYVSDHAYAMPVFRHKNFQVEMYLFIPATVPQHAHPFVEITECHHFDGKWNPFVPVLKYPEKHAGTDIIPAFDRQKMQGTMLTFEMWPKGATPSTIGAAWQGKTMGEGHEALIRRFFPEAYIKDGYADITRTADTDPGSAKTTLTEVKKNDA
jgi:hypothetical protein